MKKDMPLEGLRWSRDSGSALYDTPQNGRSRTGWGGGKGLRLLEAARPERAEAPSPGHRPGYNSHQQSAL